MTLAIRHDRRILHQRVNAVVAQYAAAISSFLLRRGVLPREFVDAVLRLIAILTSNQRIRNTYERFPLLPGHFGPVDVIRIASIGYGDADIPVIVV